MRAFLERPFVRHLLYYAFYNVCIVLCYVLVVSLVAFFHFLLEHHFGVIEEWIFERGYNVLLVCKVVALGIVFHFLNIYSELKYPIRDFLKMDYIIPWPKIIVIIFFLLVMMVIFGHPYQKPWSEVFYFKILAGFVGSFFFFFLDIVLLVVLEYVIPLGNRKIIPYTLLVSMIFYMVAKSTFLYADGMDVLVLFNAFLCFYLVRYRSLNWFLPALYLFFFVSVSSSFLGMDPLWKGAYSFFQMSVRPGFLELSAMALIVVAYLKYDNRLLR